MKQFPQGNISVVYLLHMPMRNSNCLQMTYNIAWIGKKKKWEILIILYHLTKKKRQKLIALICTVGCHSTKMVIWHKLHAVETRRWICALKLSPVTQSITCTTGWAAPHSCALPPPCCRMATAGSPLNSNSRWLNTSWRLTPWKSWHYSLLQCTGRSLHKQNLPEDTTENEKELKMMCSPRQQASNMKVVRCYNPLCDP